MGMPVVTVASGGLPVVDVSAGGLLRAGDAELRDLITPDHWDPAAPGTTGMTFSPDLMTASVEVAGAGGACRSLGSHMTGKWHVEATWDLTANFGAYASMGPVTVQIPSGSGTDISYLIFNAGFAELRRGGHGNAITLPASFYQAALIFTVAMEIDFDGQTIRFNCPTNATGWTALMDNSMMTGGPWYIGTWPLGDATTDWHMTLNFGATPFAVPLSPGYSRWGVNVVAVPGTGKGIPVTEAANGRGTAVTKVAAGKPGMPVIYVP